LKKSNLIKIVVTIIILVFVIIFFDIDYKAAIDAIDKPEYLLVALIFPIVVNPVISNNRWKYFLKVQGIEEKMDQLIKYNFVSIYFGLILPSTTGSDALRIYFIEKKHRNYRGKGGASVIIERLFGFIILAFLGFIGSLFILFRSASLKETMISGSICVVLLVVLFAIKNTYLRNISISFLTKIKRWPKIISFFSSLIQAIHQFPVKRSLKVSIPLILSFQFSTILCGYLIFKAVGVDLPFFYHLALFPLIQIISIIPVSLSGFGLREGSFVYFYGMLGVSKSIAFGVSLIYYAILILVPAFIGMLIYLNNNNSYKRQ
jgi:glycosyltransferase 2 family protein